MSRTLRHSGEELKGFAHVAEQFEFRKNIILKFLEEKGIDTSSISAVIGRGGLVKPIASGIYEINEALKKDLINPPMGEHASNLGGLIAADIASDIPGAKAYIADPVVVDEMEDVAHVAGHPLFRRKSIFHALNQKAVARIYADKIGKSYDNLNLIVAHMGGGVSVGAHRNGQVIDVNNTLDGEGPMSPERSGTLPTGELVDICFSGKYSHDEIRKMISGAGGLIAHTGSNDVQELMERYKAGDKNIQLIIDAMSYNVGKSIGAAAAVLHGHVDAIILTGGIAHNSTVCEYIKKMVSFIAPVEVMPGEDEMRALAENALRALKGEQKTLVYK